MSDDEWEDIEDGLDTSEDVGENPPCVVTKIREEFPEPSGVYVNFDGDDEGADGVSEIIEAWEYMES